MTYIYRLAGEDLELAKSEIRGFLRSQNIKEDPSRTGRLAFTDSHPTQLRRLALVHEVSEKVDPDRYKPSNSFKVRAKNLSGTEIDVQDIEESVGSRFKKPGNTVDLETPDEVIKYYETGENQYIGRQVENIPRGTFNQRSAEKRPFSEPISLDPWLARVMVNLSEVPAGKHILDPFCGTGGILIEAGLCGIGVKGIDNQKRMVEGTKENLVEYGIINYEIKNSDFRKSFDIFDKDKVEAIITDLPYGKSSKTDENTPSEFIEWARNTGVKTVFMYNRSNLEGLEANHSIRIHQNLTRYIYKLNF